VDDIAYLDVDSDHLREENKNAIESENYPVVVTFSYGDPLDEEVRATTVSPKAAPIENQMRGRFGWDLGTLSEPGGFSSRQMGFMVQGRYEPHRRYALEFHRLLAGSPQFTKHGQCARCAAADDQRLDESDVSLGAFLSKSGLRDHCGSWPALSSMGAQLEHDYGGYIGRRLSQTVTVAPSAAQHPIRRPGAIA